MPAETHVEGEPMERNDVVTLVKDRLAEILEIEPSEINEGDAFAEDLDADSLALIELVEAIEEELAERTTLPVSASQIWTLHDWVDESIPATSAISNTFLDRGVRARRPVRPRR